MTRLDKAAHLAGRRRQTLESFLPPSCVDSTQGVCLLVGRPGRGGGLDGSDRHLGGQGRRHLALEVVVAVEEGQGIDGGRSNLSVSPVLQNDGVSGPRHRVEGRVLEGGDAGVWWQSIEENHLKKSLDIRKEAHHMIQELTGQLVTNRAGLPELSSQLVGSASKVT